jgi:hypothetical protein
MEVIVDNNVYEFKTFKNDNETICKSNNIDII